MPIAAQAVVALVALIHLYILYIEMFAWEKVGPRTFRGFPRDLFGPTKMMAANQGLYNGFLAAGLVWSLLIADPEWSANVALFFLLCVAVAGVYGAVTVDRKIALVQTAPAAVGVLLLLLV